MAINPKTRYDGRSGQSLIQKHDAEKALVAKMRMKLARVSDVDVRIEETKRRAVRKDVFRWGSKLGVAIIIILANLTYLGYRHEQRVQSAPKHALTLPAPKARLSTEDQALYWTYALYDYDRLKSRFGVPANAVVDAATASARLQELLPKVDAHTRSLIEGYLPPARRKP